MAMLDTLGRRNRRLADRRCEKCGNEFRPLRSASRFCSRPCMWAQNGKDQTKRLQVWWHNGKGYIEGRVQTAQGERRVKQHRFFTELRLGRRLRADEDVHHINGVKDDNRPENLELLSHGEHSGRHNRARFLTRIGEA